MSDERWTTTVHLAGWIGTSIDDALIVEVHDGTVTAVAIEVMRHISEHEGWEIRRTGRTYPIDDPSWPEELRYESLGDVNGEDVTMWHRFIRPGAPWARQQGAATGSPSVQEAT